MMQSRLGALLVVAATLGTTSCAPRPSGVRSLGEGLDPTSLPANIQPAYELFAQRCSKCHSLSRALDNGHVEDQFWERYVDRMRHQPGSGIAPDEVPSILRFLHYYSLQLAPASGAAPSEQRSGAGSVAK